MVHGRLLPELVEQLDSPECKVSDLSFVMKAYVAAMEALGSGKEADEAATKWPSSPYAFSKLAVHYMSMLQQKLFDLDPEKDVIINAVCPGFCNTDFTKGRGKLDKNFRSSEVLVDYCFMLIVAQLFF